MMRKVKRLLCGALAALLIFGGALTEEGVADAEAQAAIEAQQRAEQEAREQAEREARERAEQEAREKAEREAKEKAEREAKEKAEREAKEKAEREAKEKAEREAKEKAEREAKEKAEREAKEKAEQEAREKAEREAKEKAEREAKEKAAQEAAPKQEQATKAENPKEDKQEEKPAVKEEKQEEKPVVKKEKPAVIEDKQEEKPVVKEGKPEEAPEEKPAEKPAEASNDTPERAPEPIPEDQPDEAPAEEAEEEIASDAAEEATEESPEESPEPSEEDMTDAPVDVPEDAPAAVPEDIPAAASEEEIPAVIEEVVEAVEAFAADESAQSRIDAQAAPPAGGTASPEPIALPETLATEVASAPAEIALVPEASKGVTGKDGVYQIATGKKAADATLSFPLTYAGACTGYKVSIVDAQGNVVYSGAQAEPAFVLDLSAYQTGSYMLVVEAVSGDAVVAWGQYNFALASGGGFPGGFPGGGFPGGGFPGRGGSGGAPDGAADEVEQGFQVTPGEALAGSHIAGTKDLQLYGTVPLTLPDGAMTELILGDASLGIVLDGGRECFTAAIDGDKLTLTADGGGVWSFNGLALRILSDSGIETLVLENREGARDIATGQPLAGRRVRPAVCGGGGVVGV